MLKTKPTPIPINGQARLSAEVWDKVREEVRRIATNGTAQGRRYAEALCQKYPQLRNA